MKKLFLLLIAIVALDNRQARAQAPPDSVLKGYHTNNEQDRIYIINHYLRSFDKNDSLLTKKSLELIAYFKKQNDDAGIDYAQIFLANKAAGRNDYSTALNIALPVLSACKIRDDTTGILWATNIISFAYGSTKNYTEAIKYLQEQTPIYLARRDKRELSKNYSWIGSVYAEAFMPDSGLIYVQQSLSIAYELKNDSLLNGPLGTLAENYIAKGDYDLSIPFLRKAMLYINTGGKNFVMYSTCFVYNDFAQAYLGMQVYDSSIYYAHRSLSFSIPISNIPQQLRTYEYLYKCFDETGRQDSSNKYFRLAAIAKDSLFNLEKVKAIEAASFSALLRQQELDAEKKVAEEQRRQDLQFVLIAIGIVAFIILFLLLGQSVIVNERFISFLAILGLLIVFEFINLLIHPLLEKKTNHSPVLMLVALVIVASLLIPLHHRMEKWIKEKMTEKNKRIRLAAAKKTIEKLEVKPIRANEKKE
jgi:hypothetical protein